MSPRPLKFMLVAILWLWLAVLLATHYGERSPYSYGWAIVGGSAARINGAVVNPDSSIPYFTEQFLYDGVLKRPTHTQNLRLPLHSFAVAIAASFTRSFLASSYAVNLIFLGIVVVAAVNLAGRSAPRWVPMLVAMLTVLSLPMFVTYIGQPLHYSVGTAVNFLVVLSIFAMRDEEVRNPWIAGTATAILTLSYDPYVFLAAVVLYVCWFVRFARARDYSIYAVVAIAPRAIWQWFIDGYLSHDIASPVRDRFLMPLARSWLAIIEHPIQNVMLPFVASHIGFHIAVHQVIAMIYWPVLLLCIVGLFRVMPTRWQGGRWRLVVLLPVFFFIEQLVSAAFDWENNPRRAIPVVLALAFALCVVAEEQWPIRRWRILLVAALTATVALTFADTMFRNPVITYLATGQAITGLPKDAVAYQTLRLTRDSMQALMSDDRIVWHDVSAATPLTGDRTAGFIFCQLFIAANLAALFWLLGKAELLPRSSWLVVCGIWMVSLVVRFL